MKVRDAKKKRLEEFQRLAVELDLDVSEIMGEDKTSQSTTEDDNIGQVR